MHEIIVHSQYFYHQTNTSRYNVCAANNIETAGYVVLFIIFMYF